MYLCSLGDTVRETAARRDLARDAGAEDEGAAVWVGIERRQGRAEGEERGLDVHCKALIPVVGRRGIQVAVGGEARVALKSD